MSSSATQGSSTEVSDSRVFGPAASKSSSSQTPSRVAPEKVPGRQPIRMLHDRILVTFQNEGERRSRGGLLIPATAKTEHRLAWGEAVAIGPQVRNIEVGDQVLFSPDDRHEVEVQGDDYLILRERDVHAVASTRIESATGLYL